MKRDEFKNVKIVSGGQTGVDRGALEAAMDLGLDFEGWAPHGWIAEGRTIPRGVIVPHRNRTRPHAAVARERDPPSVPPRWRLSQSTPPSRQCRSGSHRRKSFKMQAKTSYQGKNDAKRVVF